MKEKILTTVSIFILSVLFLHSQTSTINVTSPGSLSSLLGSDKTTIIDLTLTGTINNADFTTIKEMSALLNLNMSAVNITDNSIPTNAFQNKRMNNIILPSSLKVIEDRAFFQASLKETLVLPASLITMGNSVFSGASFNVDFSNCTRLESVGTECFSTMNTERIDLSRCTGLTTFGSKVFSNCSAHVDLPANTTTLKEGLFQLFKGSIDLSDSILAIEDRAFFQASLKETLVLPASLITMGNSVFSGASFNVDFSNCTRLESVGTECFSTMNTERIDLSRCTGLTTFGSKVFSNCSAHVDLPANTTTLKEGLFQLFKGSIDLSDSILAIEDRAFFQASLKETLVLPASLITMGNSVFSGTSFNVDFSNCTRLESVGTECFSGMNTERIDLSRCTGLTTFGSKVFSNCSAHVDLPANTTTLKEGLFQLFKGSTKLPSGLISIGNGAFQNAALTKALVLPNSLKTIGNSAFQGATLPGISFENPEGDASGVSCF